MHRRHEYEYEDYIHESSVAPDPWLNNWVPSHNRTKMEGKLDKIAGRSQVGLLRTEARVVAKEVDQVIENGQQNIQKLSASLLANAHQVLGKPAKQILSAGRYPIPRRRCTTGRPEFSWYLRTRQDLFRCNAQPRLKARFHRAKFLCICHKAVSYSGNQGARRHTIAWRPTLF